MKEVKPGKYHINNKCQYNVLNYAIENNEDSIILCTIDDKWHFINKTKNGEYIDNTIGHLTKFHEYKFIKEVNIIEIIKDLDLNRGNFSSKYNKIIKKILNKNNFEYKYEYE